MANSRKYHNQPTEYGGRTYHSKAEARCAAQLDLMLRVGEIESWRPQPRYKLVDGFDYVADFEVVGDKKYGTYAVDVKGFPTQRFRDVKRLWGIYGTMPLLIVHYQAQEWINPGQVQPSNPA